MKIHRKSVLSCISLLLFLLLAVGLDGAQRVTREYSGQFANPWAAIVFNSPGPLVWMAAALALAWVAFRVALPLGLRIPLFLVGFVFTFFPVLYWTQGGMFVFLARFPALAVDAWPNALGAFSRLAGAFILLVSFLNNRVRQIANQRGSE